MFDVTGKIRSMSLDFKSGKFMLALEINEAQMARNLYDELNLEEKLRIKIDKYREKRSLNSNAYAWLLIGKIADETRLSKEEVYLQMLKDYGQSELISVLSHIPIHEYVKYCEEAGESTLNGKLFKHYKVFKGSSEFDTREMSIFIDGIVAEAENLGIPTMTPNEIARMNERWSNE